MRKNWKNNTALSFMFLLVLLVQACSKTGDEHDHADTYICPMHPTVVSDRPATCPVCGMDLVRKARPGEEVEITDELSRLIKSPNETVIASVKMIKGEFKALPVKLEAQGIVTYDPRSIYTIPSRITGRLEKVLLKYPFQLVRKGQKVAEIYSAELVTAQRELLFLLENDSQNQQLISASKDRLRLLGATDSQINELIRTGEPENTFAIYSPYNGYVISESQQTPVAPLTPSGAPASGMGNDMSQQSPASSSSPAPQPESIIREGTYVSSGQTLFRIVNTTALRVELNIPSTLTNSISKGTDIALDFGDGQVESGKVDFVQPFLNEGENFISVRIYTPHSEKLHIGHLVTAKLSALSKEALWIPIEALLDLGVEKVVFIKDKKVLKPKKVTVGARTGDSVEIIQGLSSSDEIAANAQYLIDSESFIKTPK